jgi:DNA-binding MarR family transcriptional regulator
MSSRPVSRHDYVTLAEFRYALRVFQRFSEDAARSAGVTPAQHQLVLAVKGWPRPEPPSVSDIAERLQLRTHSTVELVRRAEQAGLVTTRVDTDDHRRQLLEVTDHGEQLLAALSALHRDELRRFRTEMNDLLGELG